MPQPRTRFCSNHDDLWATTTKWQRIINNLQIYKFSQKKCCQQTRQCLLREHLTKVAENRWRKAQKRATTSKMADNQNSYMKNFFKKCCYICTFLQLPLQSCGLFEPGVHQCGALPKDMTLTTHMAHCQECACTLDIYLVCAGGVRHIPTTLARPHPTQILKTCGVITMISLHSQQGHRYIRSLLILLKGYNCTCLRVLVLALKGCGLFECGVNQCGALEKDMAQCTNISLTTHMAHCRECACKCAGLAHLCLHTCSDSYFSSTF